MRVRQALAQGARVPHLLPRAFLPQALERPRQAAQALGRPRQAVQALPAAQSLQALG